MITKETIDKIFSTIRVEEIIGEYVQLKKSGANYKGLSPFVDEKTPSFIVSPSKQIWKDFSSGKGGSAISFLMEIEGFSYPEALRYAAKKYGIEIEENQRQLSEEEKLAITEKDLLYKIHEVANNFFQTQLHETEEGQLIGLSYLKERELKDEIIKKFQLGYSPEKRNAFTEYAYEKAYTKDILEKSGLSFFSETSPNGVDRFRERVIFPIHSFSGRVLGFGGRILKSNLNVAKYLNSPETEIYHKSNILYGLYQSKQAISKQDFCLLVEGYMDVISLHQAGIENVVASSGTSLTEEHIKLIKRLTENVTILFDGDSAGIKASFRSIDMLLSAGMNIRVLLFPDGDDPDSFSRKHPRDFVEKFIKDNAQDFIDFKSEILLKEADNDPIRKSGAISDIVKSVANVPNALKQEVYLKQISAKFGISEQTLFNELGVKKQLNDQQNRNQPIANSQSPIAKMEVVQGKSSFENPLLEMEEKLISLIFKYGNYIINRRDEQNNPYQITVTEEIIQHFGEDDYQMISPLNQKIVEEIKKGLENDELRLDSFFLSLMDEDLSQKLATNLIGEQELGDWKKHNIFPTKLGDKIAEEVENDILIHKSHFIEQLIYNLTKSLGQYDAENKEEYYQIIQKIMKLKQLLNTINTEKLNRVITQSHIYFKD